VVGPQLTECVRRGRGDTPDEARQRLACRHDVQVRVRPQVEGGQGVVELLAVLPRDQRQHVDLAATLERVDDGRHLVRLGPGAERDDDARLSGAAHTAPRPAPRHAFVCTAKRHAGALSRLTSARRANETAAMSTTVSTSVSRVSAGGVDERSMPATPSARVAIHSRITVPRVEPEPWLSMSWARPFCAGVGCPPRRRRRPLRCVAGPAGGAGWRRGAAPEPAAVPLRAATTLTAASK